MQAGPQDAAPQGDGDEERRDERRADQGPPPHARTGRAEDTADALKEHFVLQKIAEVEKIEIEEDDIDAEIDRIAEQSDESFRKVKARLEKEDLIEALAADLLERKALDLILSNATYEDYELKAGEQQGEVATVSQNALPESSDETAPPAEGAGS